MRGQSVAAQAARLARQQCPVHGIAVSQVSVWKSSIVRTALSPTNDYTLGHCGRLDCGVILKITAADFKDGPATVATADTVDPTLWGQALATLVLKIEAREKSARR